MKSVINSFSILTLAPLYLSCAIFNNNELTKELNYPDSHKVDQVDVYFGTPVNDPYRWLEDPDSLETQTWVQTQSQFTRNILDQMPFRNEIKERVTELWNYEKVGIPNLKGDRIFYFKNSGLQNQSVLYFKQKGSQQENILIDPNTLSEDGTVALSGSAISHDGIWLAYAISQSGSDWKEWRIRNVATGEDMPEIIKWSKFSGASWDSQNHGFYYSAYDPPEEGEEYEEVNYYHKLYYHKLGTPQSEDKLVYHREDHKDWGFQGYETEDGNYLIISISQGTDPRNRLFLKKLNTPDEPVVELLNEFDAEYVFLGNQGAKFWFRTDLEAPKGKVIEIDITKPEKENWKILIPEAESALRSVSLVGNQFISHYLKDAKSQIKVFQLNGELKKEISLPGIGSVSGFAGKHNQMETYYRFTSFNTPGTIYHLNLNSLESSEYERPALKFDPNDFVTKQVFYKSRDETQVPMFITHHKDLDLKKPHPTYLYGYGGFSISLLPRFSVSNLALMEMGGIYVQANLRGGAEYGEEWHKAGTKLQKQNVFDDFISAAEYLISSGYTSTEYLAIGGGSNGGLLVGACSNQRPDLFKVAFPAVGVMDMLRFQKFTIGWAWISDYGSSESSEEEFKALYAYSPYHNLKKGIEYPSTLVTTADHDDRVVPAHSFKYAARLQEVHSGMNPVLIRIETKAGHGAGKPTSKIIDEVADKWSFLFQQLNFKPRL